MNSNLQAILAKDKELCEQRHHGPEWQLVVAARTKLPRYIEAVEKLVVALELEAKDLEIPSENLRIKIAINAVTALLSGKEGE